MAVLSNELLRGLKHTSPELYETLRKEKKAMPALSRQAKRPLAPVFDSLRTYNHAEKMAELMEAAANAVLGIVKKGQP